ncbi:hypothetical protein M0R45_005827 [Rubus argutus]|uniref:Uncharacterized protein n=1 Tax=Rubus argutus TaxID=59490 RepID=A0AAW1YNR2_RUBAR
MAPPAPAAAAVADGQVQGGRQQGGFGQSIGGIIRMAVICTIPSEALKHNGSLYAHVFFARSGYPPDPNDPEYLPLAAFGRHIPL